MAKEFEWAGKLNLMARQAMVQRAIFAIQRFFSNWKLSSDKRCLTFTDGFAAGTFRLVGSRDLHFSAPDEIKRVRAIRRADGYYAQFCINVERVEESIPTGKSCWNRCRIESFLH